MDALKIFYVKSSLAAPVILEIRRKIRYNDDIAELSRAFITEGQNIIFLLFSLGKCRKLCDISKIRLIMGASRIKLWFIVFIIDGGNKKWDVT